MAPTPVSPACPFEWAVATDTVVPGAVHLVGFGFDGTACFRKGAVDGPDAIRAVSDGIESYSPYLDLDLEDLPTFYDLGNLPTTTHTSAPSWEEGTAAYEALFSVDLAATATRTLLLGGEHSVSLAPLRRALACYPDLVVVQLDAHADLRDGYEGYHYSHASIIRRALDHFGPGHTLLQYGIRSGTRDEFVWMREHGTRCNSRTELLDRIRDLPADRPVYLTLDLDYFDPSFLPGTGTPEPGGEDFHSFAALTKILRGKTLVGADVTELAPAIDPTGNSSVFAAKVVRELLLLLLAPTAG